MTKALPRWSPHLAAAILTAVLSPGAQADLRLAQSKACMACHTIDKKRVGPSFQAIAARYSQQPGAAQQLAAKVRGGSRGVWGAVPMPANPSVSEADSHKLAKWILEQK